MGSILYSSRPSNCQILVVEDDPLVLDCLAMILAASGFEVIRAEDGVDALKKFKANRFTISLLLTDVEMARMDGSEVTKRIRELEPAIKVILSSGNGRSVPPDVQPDAVLPKPYTGTQLCNVVHQVMRSPRKQDRESRQRRPVLPDLSGPQLRLEWDGAGD